jgi:hypothetical protein
MGTIAGIPAFISVGVMLVLSGFGLWHSRRVPPTQVVFSDTDELIPAGVS